MATNIQVILDIRRAKKSGTYPISFRLIHNRVPTMINTGYSIEKRYWDSQKGKVKKGCKNIPDTVGLNLLLKRREAEMMEKIISFDDKGILQDMTVSELKNELAHTLNKKQKQNSSFISFAKSVISELKDEKRYGTASAYQDALRFLSNYSGKKDISFSELNAGFLTLLEKRYMAQPTNHYNGMGAYLRAIRAIFNKAIAKGYVREYLYPFQKSALEKNKYHIRSEKTKKRAVSRDIIRQIEDFDNGNKRLMKHKRYFLFSFYTMGMNMVDLAHLQKKNISNNILTYKRAKTRKIYEIHMNQKAWDILHYFGFADKKKNDLLFPIIKTPDSNGEKIKMQIKNSTRETNTVLGIIANELGLEVHLTTYVSRHSWATIADKKGIDRRIISKGLGHSDLNTTNIYINDIVSNDDLNDANDMIIGD